jgi:predicted metalloprotease with PDZ domain
MDNDDVDADACSVDSNPGESISAILDSFKGQLKEIEKASRSVDAQMRGLFQRAKEETVNWMEEPLTPVPAVKAWCEAKGLSSTPTLSEFIDACFAAAITKDYETRALTFEKADAAVLWRGSRTLTVYDIVAAIPRLFL